MGKLTGASQCASKYRESLERNSFRNFLKRSKHAGAQMHILGGHLCVTLPRSGGNQPTMREPLKAVRFMSFTVSTLLFGHMQFAFFLPLCRGQNAQSRSVASLVRAISPSHHLSGTHRNPMPGTSVQSETAVGRLSITGWLAGWPFGGQTQLRRMQLQNSISFRTTLRRFCAMLAGR